MRCSAVRAVTAHDAGTGPRAEITHSVSRGAFYLSIEKAAALASGVLYFAMLLRWLGPSKYGIITLALSFTGLASMASGNFEIYLERFAAEYAARGEVLTLRRAQNLALGLKLVLGVLASLVLVLLSSWLAAQFHAPELASLLPVLAISVAADGLGTTGRSTLFGLQQFKWVCLLSVILHTAKTILVGALWVAHQGLFALAVGMTLIVLLQGIAQTLVPMWMMRNARNPEGRPAPATRSLLRDIMRYSFPLLGARVTFVSGQNLGKIVLAKLFEPWQLGFFSFAFQAVERFVDLVHTLPLALLPSFTRLEARGERARLANVLPHAHRIVQVVACSLSFGLFLFAREITLLVGSPLFEPAIPLLRILALVPMARTAQQPLTMVFQAMRQPGTVFRLALVKLATELAAYVALVPAIGLLGAGFANLAGAVAAYLAAFLLLARAMPGPARACGRTLLSTLLLFVPLMVAGLLIEARVPAPGSLILRLALMVVAGAGVLALRLVNRYDLERLSAMPLESSWMRRVRDALVAAMVGVMRAVEPRGAAR